MNDTAILTSQDEKRPRVDAGAPGSAVPLKDAPGTDVPVKGFFNRYDSPFIKLIAPLVATRYLWLAIEDINWKNFLNKPKPWEKPGFVEWVKPDLKGSLSRNFAALGMGLTFLSIIGLYSKNTLQDIKSIYAEAVGFELNKKKEDVTLGDIFFKSENAALKVTRGAYVRRTLARLATAATFFVPWHIFRDFDKAAPKYDANANAGVGAIGIYLLSEGFLREPSFFDVEQNMAATNIHHTDQRSYEPITASSIRSLLTIQRKHLDKNHIRPDGASEEGQRELMLAERVASLMNQTYRNLPNTENAHFTLGKLNYLVGFGMMDSYPANLAFVELANRSGDMNNVKAAAVALAKGQDPQAVFGQFGIDINGLQKPAEPPAPPAQTTRQTPAAANKFTETVGKHDRDALQPKSHHDHAATKSDLQPGM